VALQALAAFDEAQRPDDAIAAVTHLRELGALEIVHRRRMQCAATASILDRRESTGRRHRPTLQLRGFRDDYEGTPVKKFAVNDVISVDAAEFVVKTSTSRSPPRKLRYPRDDNSFWVSSTYTKCCRF
jgi:hypothetical protein